MCYDASLFIRTICNIHIITVYIDIIESYNFNLQYNQCFCSKLCNISPTAVSTV